MMSLPYGQHIGKLKWLTEKTHIMKPNFATPIVLLIVLLMSVTATDTRAQAFFDNTIDANPSLPVQLVRFAARMVNANAQLNWTTASEQNNSRFEIERSLDGANFTTIGTVAGRGNSAITTEYAYTDMNTPEGTLYYRLRQVDKNGASKHSPIIKLEHNIQKKAQISVRPNPANGNAITISFDSMPVGKYTVSLMTINGARIAQQTIDHRVPAEVLNLNFSNKLPAGVYMISVGGGEHTVYQKLIVE
jgi:hypothetical protein